LRFHLGSRVSESPLPGLQWFRRVGVVGRIVLRVVHWDCSARSSFEDAEDGQNAGNLENHLENDGCGVAENAITEYPTEHFDYDRNAANEECRDRYNGPDFGFL